MLRFSVFLVAISFILSGSIPAGNPLNAIEFTGTDKVLPCTDSSLKSLNEVPSLCSDDEISPYSARLLSHYITYASVTGNENQAGIFISNVARQKGFHVEILTDQPGSFNFTASLYPLDKKKPNVIFLNHIDVVPASSEPGIEYTYPPFSGTIAEGKIWGRGAIDNKGMAVMQLLGLEYFLDVAAEIDLPFNVTMLSVSGEETGGYTGAKIMVDEFLDYLNPVAVYGEGGSGIPGIIRREPDRKLFGISTTFKRSLWLELTLKNNTSGHGAVPPPDYVVKEKVQALSRLLNETRRISFCATSRNMFRELGKIEGGARGMALRNLRLFRPFVIRSIKQENIVKSLLTNTITITSINSPMAAANQIPQEIVSVLDCRLLPETTTEDFLEHIHDILANDLISIRVIHEKNIIPPTVIDAWYYYMREALQMVYPGAGVIPIIAPASNDNNYFREHGIPTYGIMPVFIPVHLLETIHNVDERIPVEALEQGKAVYRELIRIIIESKIDQSAI